MCERPRRGRPRIKDDVTFRSVWCRNAGARAGWDGWGYARGAGERVSRCGTYRPTGAGTGTVRRRRGTAPRPTHRAPAPRGLIALALVVLLPLLTVAVALRLNYAGDPADGTRTRGKDAIWLGHAWVDGRKTDADVSALARRPAGHRDPGPVRPRGTPGTRRDAARVGVPEGAVADRRRAQGGPRHPRAGLARRQARHREPGRTAPHRAGHPRRRRAVHPRDPRHRVRRRPLRPGAPALRRQGLPRPPRRPPPGHPRPRRAPLRRRPPDRPAPRTALRRGHAHRAPQVVVAGLLRSGRAPGRPDRGDVVRHGHAPGEPVRRLCRPADLTGPGGHPRLHRPADGPALLPGGQPRPLVLPRPSPRPSGASASGSPARTRTARTSAWRCTSTSRPRRRTGRRTRRTGSTRKPPAVRRTALRRSAG